jgi:hypothetical protein
VIKTAGDEKPAKVSEYVKVPRTRVPGAIEGVQLGFGQTCGAENGLTDCAGTRNCPFLVEATVAELLAEKVAVWVSTRLPPWLVQLMVAE